MRSSLVPRRCPYFEFRLAMPASSRMAFRAHRGMAGIGGAVWLVLSVRAVREEDVEARLVVEVERNAASERRLLVFRLSLSVSLVARDDVEMIDRRFAKLRSRLPSSASSLPLLNSPSLSSSLEEDEAEEPVTMLTEPPEVVGCADWNEVVSGL